MRKIALKMGGIHFTGEMKIAIQALFLPEISPGLGGYYCYYH